MRFFFSLEFRYPRASSEPSEALWAVSASYPGRVPSPTVSLEFRQRLSAAGDRSPPPPMWRRGTGFGWRRPGRDRDPSPALARRRGRRRAHLTVTSSLAVTWLAVWPSVGSYTVQNREIPSPAIRGRRRVIDLKVAGQSLAGGVCMTLEPLDALSKWPRLHCHGLFFHLES